MVSRWWVENELGGTRIETFVRHDPRIRNALPHLFTFIDYPHVPRTTNHVEGGVNSRLKELVHRHRGLPQDRKQMLVAEHLGRMKTKKPPRNVT